MIQNIEIALYVLGILCYAVGTLLHIIRNEKSR
jgi:hypothetical protein